MRKKKSLQLSRLPDAEQAAASLEKNT